MRHDNVRVVLCVVTRESGAGVMVGSVLPVLVKERLALVPKCVDASLEIDEQPALVGDDQALLRWRDLLVEGFRGV